MSGWRTTYTVARPFRFRGRSFRRGEILRADDPDVQRINDARPDLLLIRITRTRPISPRPQEVAGVRSTETVSVRPRRDWLAPSWRSGVSPLIDNVPGGVVYRATGPVRFVEPPKVDAAIEFGPDERSSFEVYFDGSSKEHIQREVYRAARYGVENGGLLYSWSAPNERGAVIVQTTNAGPDSEHAEHSMTLSQPSRIEAQMGEFTRRAVHNGMGLCGDWHTHPNANPEPSSGDRQAWARNLLRSGNAYSVGLIVIPDTNGHGWDCMEIHPWVTSVSARSDGRKVVTIQPGWLA